MEYINEYNQGYVSAIRDNTKRVRLKFETLSQSEIVQYEVTQDLLDSSFSLTANRGQGVRRTCSFTLIDLDKTYLPDINSPFWISQKFRISIGLEKNKDIYWWRQGTFYTQSVSANKDTITINGVDKFGIFGSELNFNKLGSIYEIPQGITYSNIIKDILVLNTGNGEVIDNQDTLIDNVLDNYAAPYKITKTSDDYLSSILTEIAGVMGADIYYDTDGKLNVIKSNITVNHASEPPSWVYSYQDNLYIQGEMQYDYDNTFNSVKIESADVNGYPIYYTAKNENPTSSVSIGVIPEKKYFNSNSFAFTTEECKQHAELELELRCSISINYNFESGIIPHIKEGDYVVINDPNFNFNNQYMFVQNLKFSQDGMSLSVCNLRDLPFYELG